MELLNELVQLFVFLFENKFSQIGSTLRNDFIKLKEKFKDNELDFIYAELFKVSAVNHHKILNMLLEFDQKNYSLENYERIDNLITNLLSSIDKNQPPLKKEGFLLLNAFLNLSQTVAFEYNQIKHKSETNKSMLGKI